MVSVREIFFKKEELWARKERINKCEIFFTELASCLAILDFYLKSENGVFPNRLTSVWSSFEMCNKKNRSPFLKKIPDDNYRVNCLTNRHAQFAVCFMGAGGNLKVIKPNLIQCYRYNASTELLNVWFVADTNSMTRYRFKAFFVCIFSR